MPSVRQLSEASKFIQDSAKISDTQDGFTGHLGYHDNFGTSVASLGDLDGDGAVDMAVGRFVNSFDD